MLGTLTVICFAALCLSSVVMIKNLRDRRQLERHTITADDLYTLLASHPKTLILDLRQPLDLLTDSEIIPGAKRISPKEIIENPALIPREIDAVIYCTCPSDKTSRMILREALAAHFLRIKLLKGGIAAWKAAGYPVEPYRGSFQLDNA